MPREYFTLSGEPEEPEKVSELEEHYRRNSQRYPDRKEWNAELESILATFDFATLEDLLRQIGKVSNIDESRMNFVGPDGIKHSTDGWIPPPGQYNDGSNTIGLSYESIKQVAEELGLDVRLACFAVLIHEEVHAASQQECYGIEWEGKTFYDKGNSSIVKSRLGYSTSERGEKTSRGGYRYQNAYDFFNEGVTEKVTRDLFRQYAHATETEQDEDYQNYLAVLAEKPDRMPRSLEVEFIDSFIRRLAHETGIDEDTVWKAMVRGIFEGQSLDDEEMTRLFADLISPDFLEKLKFADQEGANTEELFDLIAIPNDPSIWEKIKARLTRGKSKKGK